MAGPIARWTSLTAAALLVAAAGTTAAGQLLRPEHMSIAAVVGAEPLVQGETARLAVEFRIERGFHVNANPPSEDWLIPTEVVIEDVDGVELQRVFYPQALEKRFGFYSGDLRVYEGSVVAGALVDVCPQAPPGEHTLVVRVKYQACDDDACFAPAEATARLPVVIAPAGSPSRPVESPLLSRARFSDEPSGSTP